jgi:parallel beta-helix repeat protein
VREPTGRSCLFNITSKGVPLAGYTVIVKPGLYEETVESKRDGLPADPVVLRAESPGTVIIETPPDARIGIYIQHHHHVVDGFTVSGAAVGLKMGPHRRDEWALGLVARNNTVYGSSADGIQFRFALDGVAALNTVYGSGQSGLKYSGNGATIRDNVAHGNVDFGIYVADGARHRVWNNTAYNNGRRDIQIAGATLPPPGGRKFFVGPNGSDAYSDVQAQKSTTPWKTIAQGLKNAYPGDTVAILPGVYAVTVASIRDGSPEAPITLKAEEPWSVTIAPPGGSGVLIAHHYHVVEGLVVAGGNVGIQVGPKKTDERVVGVEVRENYVYGSGIGLKFEAAESSALHNLIHDSAQDGILWNKRSGSGATIFNNLVYRNGRNLTGEFGVTIATGARHQIVNNTVHGNLNGGIRLGSSADDPVFSTVLNNIVTGSPVGIKEPGGEYYQGQAILDHNNVHGHSLRNYDLSGSRRSKPGPNSLSVPPGFVDPENGDFRLGRRATGHPQDSPLIDRGSDTADRLGLSGRTAFTDKYPDVGVVDLGYHGTLLRPSRATVALNQAALVFDPAGDRLVLSVTVQPGPDSDGVEPGVDYVEVGVGGHQFSLPAGNFQKAGSGWEFASDGKAASDSASGRGSVSRASVESRADGSVDLTVEISDLSLASENLATVSVRIGDDSGTTRPRLRGALQFP